MSNDNSTTKFCKKCQAETSRNSRKKCKPCEISRVHAWAIANPDRVKARDSAYRVSNAEKNKIYKAAYYSVNIEKIKVQQAAWHVENLIAIKARKAIYRSTHIEKIRAVTAAWAAANKEKIRIYDQNRRARIKFNGGKLSKNITAKLFKLQKGKCVCCGQPLGSDYHLDHHMPLYLGGENIDENMQLMRKRCNLQKQAKHPVDFMRERGFLI
jgi:5-methylcytosine-specific restriction endonuclease McrA